MSDDPYARPSDPAKRHSAALTDGPDRAPARAMLKGTGFTDDDLAKPLIGVATTAPTRAMPGIEESCHAGRCSSLVTA